MRRRSISTRCGTCNRVLRIEQLERRALLAITVNTLIDEADGSIIDGDVSLRDAVANAPPGETIDFSVTGVINLTLGQIPIFQSVSLQGPGADLLTIDAAGSDSTPGVPDGNGTRIFAINDFKVESQVDVNLSGMALMHGDAASEGGAILNVENLTLEEVSLVGNASQDEGGGVRSRQFSRLTIVNSEFRSNYGRRGGGLSSQAGQTEIRDTTFELNSAAQVGGAISVAGDVDGVSIRRSNILGNVGVENGGGIYLNTYAATPTILESYIADNASEEGGGIYALNSVSVIHSFITDNRATAGDGGGLLTTGITTITGSTFSLNHAENRGGGLYRGGDYVPVQVQNSTFSGNSATNAGGALHANSFSAVTIHSSTILGNSSGSGAAGLHVQDFISTDPISAVVSNSIIAGNLSTSAQPSDVSGSVQLSYSLLQSTAGSYAFGPGNILGVAPSLGTLANNGGRIPTHLPLPGSQIIDAGDPATDAGDGVTPLFDQRGFGFFRVSGGRIDMGAVETNAANPDFDGDLKISGSDFLVWQRGYGSISPTLAEGDANHDGAVDADDLSVWTAAFGASADPAAVAATFNLTAQQLTDIAGFWESLQDADD